jgi:hypothetical protein
MKIDTAVDIRAIFNENSKESIKNLLAKTFEYAWNPIVLKDVTDKKFRLRRRE